VGLATAGLIAAVSVVEFDRRAQLRAETAGRGRARSSRVPTPSCWTPAAAPLPGSIASRTRRPSARSRRVQSTQSRRCAGPPRTGPARRPRRLSRSGDRCGSPGARRADTRRRPPPSRCLTRSAWPRCRELRSVVPRGPDCRRTPRSGCRRSRRRAPPARRSRHRRHRSPTAPPPRALAPGRLRSHSAAARTTR
jgi:hypothetical protein